MKVRITFLGSGDAFASGGRFQTCFLVEGGGARFLIDCGATALVALRRHGVACNAIDAILLSHLHGDHYGGLPFFVLDGRLVSKRQRPLVVAGPPDTAGRLAGLSEALFPGMTAKEPAFPLEVVEMAPGRRHRVVGLDVTPFAAAHSPAANPAALRIEWGGRTIAYSGDGGWSPGLVEAARGADLLIVECQAFDKVVENHMDYLTLRARFEELGADRVILTHMSADMLARVPELPDEFAEDGMTVEL